MAAPDRTSTPARPGDSLVRAGVVLFAIGTAVNLLIFAQWFFGVDERPLALNLLALAAPVGFALALIGLVRHARASQRAAQR